MWVEYVRCELEWLQNMDAKKGGNRPGRGGIEEGQVGDGDEIRLVGSDSEDEDEDGHIARDSDIPGPRPKKVFSSEVKTQLQNNPALDGAIPSAIFDISRKQAFFSPTVAEQFFDVVAEFNSTTAAGPKILQHVLDAMHETFPGSVETCFCSIRHPVAGVSPFTADFPRGLREVFARLQPTVEACSDTAALRERLVVWVEGLLKLEGLDEAIVTVLEHLKHLSTSD